MSEALGKCSHPGAFLSAPNIFLFFTGAIKNLSWAQENVGTQLTSPKPARPLIQVLRHKVVKVSI